MDNKNNSKIINSKIINSIINNISDTNIETHDIIETQNNESNITTLFDFNKKTVKIRRYSYSDAKWLTGC